MCDWHPNRISAFSGFSSLWRNDGKEPFRLVIVKTSVLNLVVVTGHCSLLKKSPRYQGPGSRGIRLMWDFMLP